MIEQYHKSRKFSFWKGTLKSSNLIVKEIRPFINSITLEIV